MAIDQQLPEAIVDAKLAFGELTLGIAPAQIVDVCRVLKDTRFRASERGHGRGLVAS